MMGSSAKQRTSGRFSQAGFGILEVVIAMGLMLFLAMGLLSLMDQSNKSQAQAQSKFSFTTLAQSIQAELRESATCDRALVLESSIQPPQPQKIQVKLGATSVKEGAVLSNYSNLKVTKLQLENFQLEGPVSPPGSKMYSADLVLGARAASKFDFKPLVTARLLVTVDAAGRFQHCTDGESTASLCQSLGGTYNPAASPPCQLTATTKMEGARLCSASTKHSTKDWSPPPPGNCCTAAENSSCTLASSESYDSCHDGSCQIITRHYICQCFPK